MGYITKRLDGKYEVGFLAQDGYERTVHDTEAEAIASYRGMAQFIANLRDDEVVVPAIDDKTAWPILAVDAAGKVAFTGHALGDAMRLAIRRTPLDRGRRYAFRVTLEAVDEAPAFVGAGI